MSLNPIISYSLTHKLRHSFFKLLPRLTNVEGNAPFLLSQHKIRKSKSLFSVLLDCWFLWYQRNWKTSVVKNNMIQRIWEGGNDYWRKTVGLFLLKIIPIDDSFHLARVIWRWRSNHSTSAIRLPKPFFRHFFSSFLLHQCFEKGRDFDDRISQGSTGIVLSSLPLLTSLTPAMLVVNNNFHSTFVQHFKYCLNFKLNTIL